ncbi:Uncharacterised protein [uncultured archaeon]|nr:Uncharacterised protein [uncultured archaeon]
MVAPILDTLGEQNEKRTETQASQTNPRNALLMEHSKLELLNAVVNNDYGKITAAEHTRLVHVARRCGIQQPTTQRLAKVDRTLLTRGLLRYTLKQGKDFRGFPYTDRYLAIRRAA